MAMVPVPLTAVFQITEQIKGASWGVKGKTEYCQYTQAEKLSDLFKVTQEICRGTKRRIWFFLVHAPTAGSSSVTHGNVPLVPLQNASNCKLPTVL